MRPRQRIVSVLLFSAAPLVTSCVSGDGTADEMEMEHVAPALVELRNELLDTEPAQALERIDHFRPLCDADGYPLVGNVATKGVGLQPSELCAEVRKLPQ
jgi:hypothetical protein